MSAIGTKEPVDLTRGVVGLLGYADELGQVQDRRRPKRTVAEFYDPRISRSRPLPGSMRARIFVRAR
jgi:hypothetical protein